MVILGIDPGTTRVGFGLIESNRGHLNPLHFGTIEPKNRDRTKDMLEVYEAVSKIIQKHKPDSVGIEKLFFFNNQKTALGVSETRGAIIISVAKAGIPIYEFTPLQVKQSVSSYGRAGKDQVQKMVKIILGIEGEIKPDDAADALAIAICCAHSIIGRK